MALLAPGQRLSGRGPLGPPGASPGSGSLGGGVVLLGHARGDTPAIADRDALILRPGPDVRAALPAGRGPPRPAPRPRPGPARVLDERRELACAEFGMLVKPEDNPVTRPSAPRGLPAAPAGTGRPGRHV
jgi:hypothetical protein